SWAAATRWAPSSCWTSWAWTSRWRSRRSCTASSATRDSLRRRCWSTWWPRAASAARRAVASANMPSAEQRPGDWLQAGAEWGGLLGPDRLAPAARSSSAPPSEGGEGAGHAHRAAPMQYVRGMSQPAKSARTPATTEPPESAAGSRAAAQRLKMRRELAAAAMELFATKGYEATTVDEIAAAAGVARRTFFRHFRSKEEAIFPDHDDTLVR